MPVCPSCGVAYLDGESHSCGVQPYDALQLPKRWSRRCSLAVFGLFAGLLWAIVPWGLFGRFQSIRSIPLALISGVVTGVMMAFLIGSLIRGLRRRGASLIAIMTLPVGAFVYGVMLQSIALIAPQLVPGRAPAPVGNPLYVGYSMILGLLMVWPLWIVLVPAAIWTTWQVRALVETRK